MKRILVLTFFLLFILILNETPAYADLITTDARAYILIDAKTGMVLCEKNADDKLYPASTTKILTALVALEKGNLDQMMTASREAIRDIGPDGMNIGINPGEELRMEDLVNALLIRSANETANIIAENLAPARKDFVDMMNKRAKELGAVNTNFTNPCGLHGMEHYTTARDLSVITRYAMTIHKFREIVAKDSYAMTPTNMHKKWDMLYTTNKLLYQTSDYFSKVTGIKSGFTSQAGFNLVSSAMNNDGMELIAVVLGETDHPQSRVVSDSKKLLEHGFQDNSIQKLTNAGQVIKSVSVSGAKDDMNVDLVTGNDFSCVLPVDKNEWKVTTMENINPAIQAPIQKGDILGYIEYERNGIKLGKVDLVAASTVERSNAAKFKDNAKAVTGNSFFINTIKIVLGFVIFFVVLRLVLRSVSRNLKSRRRRKMYNINRRLMK